MSSEETQRIGQVSKVTMDVKSFIFI